MYLESAWPDGAPSSPKLSLHNMGKYWGLYKNNGKENGSYYIMIGYISGLLHHNSIHIYIYIYVRVMVGNMGMYSLDELGALRRT